MYHLTVKLNIFFGKFDWAEDQMELNFGKECDVIEEKKEPWETRLDFDLPF